MKTKPKHDSRGFAPVFTISLLVLFMTTLGHAADPFGNGTIKTPTTASGGTGTVANLQTDDDVNYTVIKGATARPVMAAPPAGAGILTLVPNAAYGIGTIAGQSVIDHCLGARHGSDRPYRNSMLFSTFTSS